MNCKRLYNLFRNRVNMELKKSKKRYYVDYFTEHVNNIKKTWDGIKNIVNLKKTSKRTTQLNIGGKIIGSIMKLLLTLIVFLSMLDLALKNQFLKFLI